MTQAEIRAVLVSLFPPGDDELFAWSSPQSYVARELEAIATAVRLKGADAVDQLRQELRPQTATEKLPDWERIFGLSQSRTAVYGTLAGRRAQVVARWRESGASTVPNIAAALAAVLGYQPEILEHSRVAMTAAHTYSPPGLPIAIGGNTTVTLTFQVSDNAPVAQAGARVILALTIASVDLLDFTLVGPDGTTASWAKPLRTAAGGSGAFVLYAPGFAGARADGTWALTLTNSSGNAGSLQPGTGLFVEGIGWGPNGSEGRAANLFEWAVLVDPARLSAGADLDFARQLVARWNPAHCRGYLVQRNSLGGTACIFDDERTPFQGGVFG